MTVQSYDQFRTFLNVEASEALFIKQEPEAWDLYFQQLGVVPENHARVFHLTAFMTESAIVILTTVLDREIGKPVPTPDLSALPVKPTVYLGCEEGLDLAVQEFIGRLQQCLIYPNEEQSTLDRERVISHFWAGLQTQGRVSVVL